MITKARRSHKIFCFSVNWHLWVIYNRNFYESWTELNQLEWVKYLVHPSETKFNEIWIKMQQFFFIKENGFKNVVCRIASFFSRINMWISHRLAFPPPPLRWRHKEHDGVWNHQPHDCLHTGFFGRRSKETPKLHVTGLCAGNSPVTSEFPAKMASNAENVSMWWRHHGHSLYYTISRHSMCSLD